eukprot:scaffold9290_cov63-Phaeocystis_antarctica.AAC.12
MRSGGGGGGGGARRQRRAGGGWRMEGLDAQPCVEGVAGLREARDGRQQQPGAAAVEYEEGGGALLLQHRRQRVLQLAVQRGRARAPQQQLELGDAHGVRGELARDLHLAAERAVEHGRLEQQPNLAQQPQLQCGRAVWQQRQQQRRHLRDLNSARVGLRPRATRRVGVGVGAGSAGIGVGVGGRGHRRGHSHTRRRKGGQGRRRDGVELRGRGGEPVEEQGDHHGGRRVVTSVQQEQQQLVEPHRGGERADCVRRAPGEQRQRPQRLQAEREAGAAARLRVEHRGELREGATLAQQPAGERLGQLVLWLEQGAPLLRRPQHQLLQAHGHRHAVHQQVAERGGGVPHREQPQVSLVQLAPVRPRPASCSRLLLGLLLGLRDALERRVAHQAGEQLQHKPCHMRRQRCHARTRTHQRVASALSSHTARHRRRCRCRCRRRRRRLWARLRCCLQFGRLRRGDGARRVGPVLGLGVRQAATAAQQRQERGRKRAAPLGGRLQCPARQRRQLQQLLEQPQPETVRPATHPARRVQHAVRIGVSVVGVDAAAYATKLDDTTESEPSTIDPSLVRSSRSPARASTIEPSLVRSSRSLSGRLGCTPSPSPSTLALLRGLGTCRPSSSSPVSTASLASSPSPSLSLSVPPLPVRVRCSASSTGTFGEVELP